MDITITVDSKEDVTNKEWSRIMRVANMLRANEDKVTVIWQKKEELEPLHIVEI